MTSEDLQAIHPQEVRKIIEYIKKSHKSETVFSYPKKDLSLFIKKENSHSKD